MVVGGTFLGGSLSESDSDDSSDEAAFVCAFPDVALTCAAFGFSSSEELSELSSDESPAFFD